MNKVHNESESDELRGLCVDLLNYGSAAQVYKDVHDKDKFANSTLSDDDKTMARKDFELYSNLSITEDGNTSVGDWKAASLNLYSDISVLFKFTTDVDSENLVANITYGKYRNQTNITTFERSTYVDGSGASIPCMLLKFNEMNARDLNYKIEIKLVDKSNDEVSKTLTYNVETYSHNKLDVTKNGLGDLVMSIMKYIRSVEAYCGMA